MAREIIHTDRAPKAIGTYTQALKVGDTVYLSGQIPLLPESMELVSHAFEAQAHQVFTNLAAVCEAAGGTLDHVVKLNVYMTDLSHFPMVNRVMAEHFSEPYPARAAVGVNQLPKGAQLEIDGVLVL
jgi:reactive intermediate/imine deaminase